jgi:hypothetical protein
LQRHRWRVSLQSSSLFSLDWCKARENLQKPWFLPLNPMIFALKPICKAPVLVLLYLC